MAHHHLHITRKKHWSDVDHSGDISMEEWKHYIRQDHEMRLDNFAEAIGADGKPLRIEQEGIAVWTAYSREGIDGNHAWFMHIHGNIVVNNPDGEIRNKMIDVASHLQARVLGDEGEVHRVKKSRHGQRPWWKLWN